MLDLVGFGALNVDMIYEVDDLTDIIVGGRPCEPGAEMFCGPAEFAGVQELLKKHGNPRGRSAGGSAANTTVALARMGFKTGYIGQVGADDNGAFLLDSMSGVDLSRVKRRGVTGLTVVLLDPEGERTIIVLPNANDELTFEDIDQGYAVDTKWLHLTSFAGETPTQAQIKLVKKLTKVKVSFDPGEINTQKGLVKMIPVFRGSHIVFITDREIRLLTGEDYVDGAREIINYGPEIIVAKLGSLGSYVLTREEEIREPSMAVATVDKTGAGDVYAAGFIGGLLQDISLARCTHIASRAAAYSITGWGRESYPDASIFQERA